MSDPHQVARPQLERGLGLAAATRLNMIDMIGVGPFITLPLMVQAMGGPQAMLGWLAGAVFALCDGMVWSELGAAMPKAGGSYEFLKQIYGPRKLGRYLSFLFIWQLIFSAPMSIATGCIGVAQYAAYLWPSLGVVHFVRDVAVQLPLVEAFHIRFQVANFTFVAMACALLAGLLLYRRVSAVAALSRYLWVGVMGAMAWVIFAGFTHFDAHRAFDFPAGSFTLGRPFFLGMGSAMLIATYDYWGYYNVAFLGGEVQRPERNIPRAIIYSIVAVAVLYVAMNLGVLAVLPWRELAAGASGDRSFVISTMMQRLYGHGAGIVAAALIMWTAFASVFSLLLGYSRIPYAAALDGNFFRAFGNIHKKHRFPNVSLAVLAVTACAYCFLRLADVIAALVVIRIIMQFLLQTIGLLWLRARHADAPRPFRMRLYPLPAILSAAGFVYILFMRVGFARELAYALFIILLGSAIYAARAVTRREWPFAGEV